MVRNERGIALVITLLVVALLTIIVVEFTYSVEVDAHMARNSLNGLQATLLARSGVNLGEAFLLHDDDKDVDSYAEDWGNVDLLNSQLILPDNMRLRVQIIDEGGKININMTRPRRLQEWQTAQKQGGANPNALQLAFQTWTTAVARVLEGRGASPQIGDAITAYWDQIFQTLDPTTQASPNQPGNASNPLGVPSNTGAGGMFGLQNNPNQPNLATGTPTPAIGANNPAIFDFPSFDDASVIPGLSPAVIRRARSLVTALDTARQPQVNANTAPPDVLMAIIPDPGIVDNIVSQRQTQGLKATDLQQLLSGLNMQDPVARNARAMLGVKSSYFLIRASAVINPNPITGRGGISRSASMLVRRDQRPGVPANAGPGTLRWTLTQLDWQKEGGAALFQQRSDQEPGADDLPSTGQPGMGG